MFRMNRFGSSPGWLFGMVDSLLIIIGILLGCYLRYREIDSIYSIDNFVLKVILVVLVVQLGFSYSDLYDSKIFQEKKRMGFLFLTSLGASTTVLAVIYYIAPFIMLGRGVFVISLLLILIFTYLWRVFYSYALKSWGPKEKILIIGTGELAKIIRGEILDNGFGGIEIVGFIDQERDKIGRRI